MSGDLVLTPVFVRISYKGKEKFSVLDVLDDKVKTKNDDSVTKYTYFVLQ